jgi:hypothetical protein
MDKVLEALEFMAESGGVWSDGRYAGVWQLDLDSARSDSGDFLRFTQDDVREFLADYNRMKAAMEVKEIPNEN